MKMRPIDFTELQLNINAIVRQYPQLREEYESKALSTMRYRWDIFYATDFKWRFNWTKKVYKYLNDDHIDTALRKILG